MTDEHRLSTTEIARAMDRNDTAGGERGRVEDARAIEGAPGDVDARPGPLFADEELTGYRTRWSGIQTGFVDEPRKAVEEADTLVAELMKRLAESFATERSNLEKQWDRGDNVSTEDLRVALQRYRTFFDRLLNV